MSKKLCFITIIFLTNLFFVLAYSFNPSIQGIDLTTTILVNQPVVSCSFNETQGLCINTNINSFTSESCLACELCNTNPSLLGGATCNATLCNSLSSCYYNNTTRKCDQNLDKCPTCGNNIIEGSEVCDGADLNSKTCQTQGYDSGNLACNNNCLDFNYSACVPINPTPDPVCNPPNQICDDGTCCSGVCGYGTSCIGGTCIVDAVTSCNPVSNCTISPNSCASIIVDPIPTTPSGSNLNKILVLEAEKDVNLSTRIRCDFSTDANLLIKWKDGSTQINNFDCNSQLIKTLYSIPNLPKEGMVEVIATIPQPCDVCQKTVFVSISEPTQTTIPDNNLISIILFFVLIISLVFVQNKKLKK